MLLPRADCGGSANGGCDYIRFCQTCAKVERVPCLEATIHAYTGPLSGTDLTTRVYEDGVKVCEAHLKCDWWDNNCSGIDSTDCGDGNSMAWKWNFIRYTSKKYGTSFSIWLDRTPDTVNDKVEF